jgi:hypothetical protein
VRACSIIDLKHVFVLIRVCIHSLLYDTPQTDTNAWMTRQTKPTKKKKGSGKPDRTRPEIVKSTWKVFHLDDSIVEHNADMQVCRRM